MVIGCHHAHHHHHLMMASGPHTAAHMQLRLSGPQLQPYLVNLRNPRQMYVRY